MSDAVDFFHAESMKACKKLTLRFFDGYAQVLPKFPNISKKKLWMEFIMGFIKIRTSTSWIIGFWRKPHLSKEPKKGNFLSFCNILRKSIITVFVFNCDAKHSDILRGSSHVCCYLFLLTFQLSRFCQNSPGFWYAVPVFGMQFKTIHL